MKRITIPKESYGAVFKDNWKMCVGTGRLGLALQKEYMDTLAFVQKNIGFSFIRGHGLLHEDVGIYREDVVNGETKPFYNFTYIDRIFDSFLELGIKPFVELGFMPEKLASGDQTVFYWKGNVTPPKDYDKWAELIKAVVRHFIARYGMDEVLKWPFEVWNEPNLTGFWKDADEQEYFKLYKVTATAVKEVENRLQVGGPAVCGGSDHWITDFLNFCHAEGAPVDYVSRHAYTSSSPVSSTPHFIYQDIWDSDYMLSEFRKVREMIQNSPFPDLPFHITEYNTSWHPLNPVHDTAFNAAYIARILSCGGDHVDSFSYWTFSDVFEECDVPRAQFHGGFGLVALNSIPKPTYYTFSFFAKLGAEQLFRDDHLIVTRRKDGSIALVAWNAVNPKKTDKDEDAVNETAGESTACENIEMELDIPMNAKEAFVKKQTVNEEHANPLKTWMQMGRPRFPDKSMISTLQQAAQPLLSTGRQQVENGVLRLKVILTKNEVSFFELCGVNDEADTYIGLDDSHIGY